MPFSMETEKESKLSFLDGEIIREQGKRTNTIYRKPAFSGVYTDYESFLPAVCKFGMVYTLVYRCFQICSNWTQFHTESNVLKGIFQKNGYRIKKKHLLLVLPYFGHIYTIKTKKHNRQVRKCQRT